MAEALYLVRRTTTGEFDDRNRVREVLANQDDGQTDAQIIQAVIDALNAEQDVGDGLPSHDPAGENIYPDGYFDTVDDVSVSTGPVSTDGDFIAFGVRKVAVVT